MTTIDQSPADKFLGIARSKTVDQFQSKISASSPHMKLNRNASNGDLLGRTNTASFGAKGTGLLQRSHSLDIGDVSDQFKRSLSFNEVETPTTDSNTSFNPGASRYTQTDQRYFGVNQQHNYNVYNNYDQNQQHNVQNVLNGVFTPVYGPQVPQIHLTPMLEGTNPYFQSPAMGSPMLFSGHNFDQPLLYGSPVMSPLSYGLHSPHGLHNFQLPQPSTTISNRGDNRVLSAQARPAIHPSMTQFSPVPSAMGFNPAGFAQMDTSHPSMMQQNLPLVQKTKGEVMLEELRIKMKPSQSFSNPRMHPQGRSSQTIGAGRYEDFGIDWSLSDIKDFVNDFARDQFGSRFIQQKLQSEEVPQEDKLNLFEELSRNIPSLCTDVFGNYVIQKLLEIDVGTKEQHNFIYQKAIKGHVYELSSHMYGCRVIQKLIDQVFSYTSKMFQNQQLEESSDPNNIYNMSVQDSLLAELGSNVPSLVFDQNGNHVIQKCIEQIRPIERLSFFFAAFQGQYMAMSKHTYGCRVVQRVLENSTVPVVFQVISELMSNLKKMIVDQYANYVVQHIVEHQNHYELIPKDPHDENLQHMISKIASFRHGIFEIVAQDVGPFSQHKFGSNVVECCLKFGTPSERDLLVSKVLEGGTLIMMMKDPYANYVVQKVIDKAKRSQLERVITVVQQNELALRRLTYGKHIINKLKAQENRF